MKLLNLGFVLLIPFLLINISESKFDGKTVEKNSGLSAKEIAQMQSKFAFISQMLEDLEANLNPLVNLKIEERLKNLESKPGVPADFVAKVNEMERKMKLVDDNQKAIQFNKESIGENAKKIEKNEEKSKNNEAKINENSEDLKTKAEKIKENADKSSQNLLKIQDNTKKSQDNSQNIKTNVDKLKEASGNVKTNAENVDKVSKRVDQVVSNTKVNAENIVKNSNKAEENGKKIDAVSQRVSGNSANISSLANKIPQQPGKPEVTKEEFVALKEQVNLQLNTNGIEIKNAISQIRSVNDDLKSTKTELQQKSNSIADNKNALKLAKEEIAQIKIMFNKNKVRSLSPYSERIKKLKSLVYVWKISDVSKKMVGRKWAIESDVFRLNGYPFGAQVKIQPSEFSSDEIGISIAFRDNPSSPLQVLPFPEVTYVVKDLSGEAKVKNRVAPHSVQFGINVTGNSYVFEEYLMFKKRLLSGGFVKGDSMVVEVYVEPPELTHQSQSFDGKMVDCVDQLRWRVELAKDYYVWWTTSPYFYTQPHGYRVQVQLWLHYNDKIVPQVLFLSGDNDKELATSFPHKITLTVYNLNDLTNNFARSINSDIVDSTMYEMPGFTYDEVKDFLENDTLYYKVSIEPLTR